MKPSLGFAGRLAVPASSVHSSRAAVFGGWMCLLLAPSPPLPLPLGLSVPAVLTSGADPGCVHSALAPPQAFPVVFRGVAVWEVPSRPICLKSPPCLLSQRLSHSGRVPGLVAPTHLTAPRLKSPAGGCPLSGRPQARPPRPVACWSCSWSLPDPTSGNLAFAAPD